MIRMITDDDGDGDEDVITKLQYSHVDKGDDEHDNGKNDYR